jgi:hypothetical protein
MFEAIPRSVVPIEGIQLCIGVLELKRQLVASADAARHRVTHLGLLVFETIGQRDAGPVFLAGGGVFDGRCTAVDSRSAHHRTSSSLGTPQDTSGRNFVPKRDLAR